MDYEIFVKRDKTRDKNGHTFPTTTVKLKNSSTKFKE